MAGRLLSCGVLLCCWPLVANALVDDRPQDQCPSAADIVHGADQLCSGSAVARSLVSVGLLDKAGEGSPLRLLQRHGFRTTLDLRLLEVNGAEAAELMEQLRVGGVSIADRSKVRLLLGGNRPSRGSEPMAMPTTTAASGIPRTRTLQEKTSSGDGMSTDTIAIVLSLLVGAAGYLVQ
eukprot:SAG31_NODE_3708_length_3968_cov_2.486948_2_plen_178_part_00